MTNPHDSYAEDVNLVRVRLAAALAISSSQIDCRYFSPKADRIEHVLRIDDVVDIDGENHFVVGHVRVIQPGSLAELERALKAHRPRTIGDAMRELGGDYPAE